MYQRNLSNHKHYNKVEDKNTPKLVLLEGLVEFFKATMYELTKEMVVIKRKRKNRKLSQLISL